MTRLQPLRLGAVAVLAGLCVAGCDSGAPDATGLPAHAKYGVFSGSVHFTGELAAHGSFTDAVTSRQETCDEYAHGLMPSETLWVVPTPTDGNPVSGHTVMYTAGVPSEPPSGGFHGPAEYSGLSALLSVLVIDDASFLPGPHAMTVIRVSADASGTMSFTGMVDTFSNANEDGSVTWTCQTGSPASSG